MAVIETRRRGITALVTQSLSMTGSIARDPPDRQTRLLRMIQSDYRFIWRLLRRLGVPAAGVDDAVQQVFLVAAERIDDIKESSERSFAFGTAVRVAQTARRRGARETIVEPDDFGASSVPGPDELTDQKRARQMLDRVLAGMPVELRTVFVLFELEGLTSPEIALVVGVRLGTVASRLRRARELFRERVQEETKIRTNAKGHP